jgi:hypothetical protein
MAHRADFMISPALDWNRLPVHLNLPGNTPPCQNPKKTQIYRDVGRLVVLHCD